VRIFEIFKYKKLLILLFLCDTIRKNRQFFALKGRRYVLQEEYRKKAFAGPV